MRRLLGFSFVFLVLSFGVTLTVLAHGGGTPQLTNEPVGSYLLSTWTNPNPAVVGVVHVTSALAEASTGAAVTDPVVRITATLVNAAGAGAGAPIVAEATHTNATIPIFYEADMEVPTPGDWRFALAVDGAQGAGTAAFTLSVRPAGPNWLLLGLVGVGVVLVAGLGWMLLRGDAGHKRRPGASQSGAAATGSEDSSR